MQQANYRTRTGTWPGILVEYAVLPPHKPDGFTSSSDPHHAGVSFSPHRRAVWEVASAAACETDIPPGAVFVTSARPLHWMRVAEPAEALEMYPDQALLRAIAATAGRSGPVELDEAALRHDPVVFAIAHRFRRALRGGDEVTDVEGHELALHLGRHLLRYYAGFPPEQAPPKVALSLAQIRRVDDWIEANLNRPLPLDRMAKEVGQSPFHFARAFKKATGAAPHAHVTARRMERAKVLLLTTGWPTDRIAAAVGYAGRGHFRRQFRRHFGCGPGALRTGL